MNCRQCGCELASVPLAPVPPWIGHKLTREKWLAWFVKHGGMQERDLIRCYVERLEDRFQYVTEQLQNHQSGNYQ